MILKKQQLIEAGMSFSQQNSLGSTIIPTKMYFINGCVLALSMVSTPITSPSTTGAFNIGNTGITWSRVNRDIGYKIAYVASNNVLMLSRYTLAKITLNNLYNTIRYGYSLNTSSSLGSLQVTVSVKSSSSLPSGGTTYTTETWNISVENNIRDIASTTDGVVICAASNKGLIYSEDSGGSWKKACNNISGLSIYNVLIWSGTVSGTATKYYIALTSNSSGWRLCSTRNLTENNDHSWNITGSYFMSSSASVNDMCQINDLVFICTSQGLYYFDPNYGIVVQAISDKTCYSIVKNNSGKYIVSTANGIVYSDNLSDWVEGDSITNGILLKTSVNNKERIIAINNSNSYYSENKTILVPFDASKPLTGVQAKELVQQCKAYVQTKKAEMQQQNNNEP